jgi:hypothetical protein
MRAIRGKKYNAAFVQRTPMGMLIFLGYNY